MSYRDRSIPERCVLGDTQLLIPKNLKYRETRSTMLRWPSPTRAAISFRLRVVQTNNSFKPNPLRGPA